MTLAISANHGIVSSGASNLLKVHVYFKSASFPKGKAAGVRVPQGPGLLLTGSKLPPFCGSSKPLGTALSNSRSRGLAMRAKQQAESAKIYPFPHLQTAERIDAVRLRISLIEMAILGLSELHGRTDAANAAQIMLSDLCDELASIRDAVHPPRGGV